MLAKIPVNKFLDDEIRHVSQVFSPDSNDQQQADRYTNILVALDFISRHLLLQAANESF